MQPQPSGAGGGVNGRVKRRAPPAAGKPPTSRATESRTSESGGAATRGPVTVRPFPGPCEAPGSAGILAGSLRFLPLAPPFRPSLRFTPKRQRTGALHTLAHRSTTPAHAKRRVHQPRSPSAPQGLRLPAQGCAAGATLGPPAPFKHSTPTGLRRCHRPHPFAATPLGFFATSPLFPRVAAARQPRASRRNPGGVVPADPKPSPPLTLSHPHSRLGPGQ